MIGRVFEIAHQDRMQFTLLISILNKPHRKPVICSLFLLLLLTFHFVDGLVRDILLALLLLLLPPGLQLLVCGHDDDTPPLHLLKWPGLAQLSILVHIRLNKRNSDEFS